ncbi:hypothetical protein [Saccharopolyspora dendranthemae]|nr:hypothetical protein [Saccharopolyspora dendranthemae]
MSGQLQWIGNLITAVATLSGVLIAQFFARRTEKTKALREDATRWMQDRREAYTDFLAAVWQMREFSVKMDTHDSGEPERPTVEERRKDLARAHELLYIIAPPDVLERADELREALATFHTRCFDLILAFKHAEDKSAAEFAYSDHKYAYDLAVLEAAAAFREAVRLDLGVDPQAQKLRRRRDKMVK